MVNGHAVLQKHCFLCMWRTWSNQTCKVIRFCASNSCSARTTAFFKVIKLESPTLFSSLSNFSYQTVFLCCSTDLFSRCVFNLIVPVPAEVSSAGGQREGALLEIYNKLITKSITHPTPFELQTWMIHVCCWGELCCYFTKWSDASFSPAGQKTGKIPQAETR